MPDESLDLRPRLLVHHVLGDFVVDPWTAQGFDLSRYGVTGYEVHLADDGLRPTITVHHRLGDFVLDPLGTGTPADLSAYGITSWEVVWGQPAIPAGQGLGEAFSGIGLLLLAGVALVVLARRGR